MKILISAPACNPYSGSEPGVGWTAVCRIAKMHDVFVLVDARSRLDWEKAQGEGLVPANVQARFVRKATTYVENRFIARIQGWIWYRHFTRLVLKEAQAWHAEEKFDVCHQVTIAAWRIPSPLWQLPIPFIWGPIGGAGYIPKPFRKMLSPSARIFERVRDFQTWLVKRSQSFRLCIKNTAIIFAANEETQQLLVPFRNGKPVIWLPIVSVSEEKIESFRRHPQHQNPQGSLRLFAGGNIEGRKGVSLALRALAIVETRKIDFHYTIAGGGPEIASLKLLSEQLGLEKHVTFHPGFHGKDYIQALHETDVYLLPSFRESTPVTMIEAYLAGCYPVVADTSAQGEIVRLVGGKAIPIESMDSLINGLADGIIWCAEHRDELFSLASTSAAQVAEKYGSRQYEETLAKVYDSVFGETNKS